MKQQIGVKAIIERDNKVLLIKRSRIYGDLSHSWDIPGGRINFGEDPIDGLKREIAEETGLNLKEVHQILDASTVFQNEQKHIVRLTFLCSIEEGSINLSEEHTEIEWCPIATITQRQFKDKLLQKTIEKQYKKKRKNNPTQSLVP